MPKYCNAKTFMFISDFLTEFCKKKGLEKTYINNEFQSKIISSGEALEELAEEYYKYNKKIDDERKTKKTQE